MSANEVDLQPETQEVLQAETPYRPEPPVLVEIQTPVRTQELPRKAGATRTQTIGTTPQQLLRADHRRARVVLMSVGQSMLVAFSKQSASSPDFMVLWPANVQFVVTTATEIWVASSTGTTSIGYATELWATGD